MKMKTKEEMEEVKRHRIRFNVHVRENREEADRICDELESIIKNSVYAKKILSVTHDVTVREN